MRAIRRAICLGLALSASGCRILEFDSCLYELRGVEGVGAITEGGSEFLYGRLNLLEQRDYQADKSLIWEVRGAPLLGHVTSIVFRDVSDPSKALAVLPLSSSTLIDISNGVATESSGADLSGIFDVLAADRGAIDVRTDLPGRDSLRVTLRHTFVQDWYRPKCG